MERPPKKYVCEKCGYLGDTSEHEGCDYLAWTTGEQLCIDQLERELALLKASPVGAPEVRESVIEAIAEALGDAYDCTRVWSAWSYGTMSQDDFSLVAEDRSRLEEIADAAMLAAAPTPPVSEDRKELELYGELLYAVANKFSGESRHQTALRYIRNAEKGSDNATTQEDKP